MDEEEVGGTEGGESGENLEGGEWGEAGKEGSWWLDPPPPPPIQSSAYRQCACSALPSSLPPNALTASLRAVDLAEPAGHRAAVEGWRPAVDPSAEARCGARMARDASITVMHDWKKGGGGAETPSTERVRLLLATRRMGTVLPSAFFCCTISPLGVS